MRIALATLLISGLLTAFGCEQSQPASSAPATPDSAQAEPAHRETNKSDEAGVANGNVISRNLPRFHDAFESDEAFLVWRETFYSHQQFDRLPEAIGYFCTSGLYEDVYNRIPMAAFVGAVLKQSDKTVDHCWDELMLEGRVDELMTLGYGAWLADTPHSRQMYYNAREIWEDDDLTNMFHMHHQAKNLDTMDRPTDDFRVVMMLWNEFYATGDEQRLRRLVKLSYMHNAPEGTWQRRTGQEAMTRLVRLLPFDTTVRRIVEDEAANNKMTQIRTHLTRLLEEAGTLRKRPGISPTP